MSDTVGGLNPRKFFEFPKFRFPKKDARPEDPLAFTTADLLKLEVEEINRRRQRRNYWREILKTPAAAAADEAPLEYPADRPTLAALMGLPEARVSAEVQLLLQDLGEDDPAATTASAEGPAATRIALTPEGGPSLCRPTGLCLSGGGIRSASFCLGAIQGLQHFHLFENMDYLSTVSGGGYIGASFTAANACAPAETGTPESTQSDEPDRSYESIFRHEPGKVESIFFRYLRNNANYLKKEGLKDLLPGMVSVAQGAVVNLLVFSSTLVVATFLYALLLRTAGAHLPDWSAGEWTLRAFVLFGLAACVRLVVLYLERRHHRRLGTLDRALQGDQIRQSVEQRWWLAALFDGRNKGRGFTVVTATFLLFLLVVVVLAFNGFVRYFTDAMTASGSGFFGGVAAAIGASSFALVPFRQQILAIAHKLSGRALMTAASALSVLFIVTMAAALTAFAGTLLDGRLQNTLLMKIAPVQELYQSALHAVATLNVPAAPLLALGPEAAPGAQMAGGLFLVILSASLLILLMTLRGLDINATSLHAYYRDRLSRAFIFTPFPDHDRGPVKDAAPLGKLPMSSLVSPPLEEGEVPNPLALETRRNMGPYPLINAALNISGKVRGEKKGVNEDYYKRGRRSDFFLFSPLGCGSRPTRYVRTALLEEVTDIDLGTAIAISGAAVAPNAGNRLPRLASVALTLLNARLNYWLPNPRAIKPGDIRRWSLKVPGLRYFLGELVGSNQSDTRFVNLSDGGHIENIGLYQLLLRRCTFIIVCDAGCDPDLTFGDFSEALRMAQIDLGVRVEMEGLDEIRSGDQAHATGKILYDEGIEGRLLLLKQTMPGDNALEDTLGREAFLSSPRREDNRMFDAFSYISAYAAKNPAFPHDSTADQFFDEEQFEAYRALGYQIAMAALSAR